MADIVSLKEVLERGPAGIKKKKKIDPFCRHPFKSIDTISRYIECENCKAELDPFDCVVESVNDFERLVKTRDDLLGEVDRLRANAKDKLKLLRSLDDKIRRRKEKLLNLVDQKPLEFDDTF